MSREGFIFSYLCSDIKTKPNNHGLRESGKTSPPLISFHIILFLCAISLTLIGNNFIIVIMPKVIKTEFDF